MGTDHDKELAMLDTFTEQGYLVVPNFIDSITIKKLMSTAADIVNREAITHHSVSQSRVQGI